jgi:hypothetical protein
VTLVLAEKLMITLLFEIFPTLINSHQLYIIKDFKRYRNLKTDKIENNTAQMINAGGKLKHRSERRQSRACRFTEWTSLPWKAAPATRMKIYQ